MADLACFHMQARRSRCWTDMIIEEDWHGRPMVDQPTHRWIIAGCVVAAAFYVGGATVPFRRPSASTRYAGATGILAVAVLVIGRLYRRLCLVHEHVSFAGAASLAPQGDRRCGHDPRRIPPRATAHALTTRLVSMHVRAAGLTAIATTRTRRKSRRWTDNTSNPTGVGATIAGHTTCFIHGGLGMAPDRRQSLPERKVHRGESPP